MKLFTFQRMYRNAITGKISPYYWEACEGIERLTLRNDFVCPLSKHKWYTDPFCEVSTIHPRELQEINRPVPLSTEKLDDVISVVCQVIMEAWDPEKFHVIFHSSGHDSRIVSGCLRKLYQRHGKDWLGNVLFLCNRWEAEQFREIMRMQGWLQHQYAAYDEGVIEEHYAISLDFDTFWQRSNAPVPMPGRFWDYLVRWAQEKGLLPESDNLQCFSGQAAFTWEYATKSSFESWLYYRDGEYYSETSIASPTRGLGILSDERIYQAVAGYAGKPQTGHLLRIATANKLCLDAVAVKNAHSTDHHAPISNRLRRQCEERFAESWYANHYSVKWQAPETADISTAWGQWSLASLCEHLINKGVYIA